MGTMQARAVVLAALLAPAHSALAGSAKASSELTTPDGVRHGASLAFDGDLTTAWAEDETGAGSGAWIELKLDRPTEVTSVSVWPGDLSKGERTLKENGRPHTITIVLDDGNGQVVEKSWRVRDGAEHGIQRADVPVQGTARTVRVRIDEAYAGYIHNDLYLAEIAVNFDQEDIPGLDKVLAWEASPKGEQAKVEHIDEVVALFDRITGAEFGDSEAMDMLEGFAANGVPYRQPMVDRYVPLGFRVQATPPDETAIDALLKIKDPNAIPALTMAGLRAHGKTARKLSAAVSYFEAFAELKGGGRRALQPWGTSGWEKGALRGLGEPLDVGLGVYGGLYVADVANHRVSVFGPDGRIRATFGKGEPTVTNAWIGGKRAHYAAGREPTDDEGGFLAPLDLDVQPGKEGDVVTVYDAEGWVRRLDQDGRIVNRWKVRPEMAPAAGYGGAAHVVETSKGVVVIQGTEAFVFSAEGEEVGAWTIEEGSPITVTALKNGKLVLGFRAGAATYDVAGRRIATFLEDGELPLGYEAWALATDEKGKVWVLTDHGWALQFTPTGKEIRRVRVRERALPQVRFAVREDFLFATAGDEIVRFDIRSIESEQAAAEE